MPSRWRWTQVAVVLFGGCVQLHPLAAARGEPGATVAAQPRAAAGAPADATAAGTAAPGPGDPGAGAAADARYPWRTVGTSVEGRPLRATTIGHGPRRVLWVGGIHGDEREGSVATRELPAAFAAQPGALSLVSLTILEDANPDGSAHNTRGNAHGVDLNRNFPATNFKPHRMFGISPLSQPESRALHDLILSVRPELVIVAHAWRNDRFINFDGPGERLAQRFSRLSSYPVRVSSDIAPTPGSLGSWVGRTLAVPILTLEYRRGTEPAAAWRGTHTAILGVLLDDGEPRGWTGEPQRMDGIGEDTGGAAAGAPVGDAVGGEAVGGDAAGDGPRANAARDPRGRR